MLSHYQNVSQFGNCGDPGETIPAIIRYDGAGDPCW